MQKLQDNYLNLSNCAINTKVVLLEDLQIIEKAAEIHADLKHKGTPIQDADVLIAATAIIKGLILVSNDSDMLRVAGMTVEDWLNLE